MPIAHFQLLIQKIGFQIRYIFFQSHFSIFNIPQLKKIKLNENMLYNIFIFQPQIKKHLNFSPNKYVRTSFDLIPEQEWT